MFRVLPPGRPPYFISNPIAIAMKQLLSAAYELDKYKM
jgi:hypothetical protein